MSWCGWVCNTVEETADTVTDLVDDVIDTVGDALEDAVDAVVEGVANAAEWAGETVSDAAEFVADVASDVWDWVTEAGGAVWDWIKQTAGDVWEWAAGAADDAWDWVKDTTADGWDWVANTAESVWDSITSTAESVGEWLEENVAPFLLDTLWVLTHIDDALVGGGIGLLCLVTQQDEKEYDVIEGIYRLDEDALRQRKVAFLPKNIPYVIVSDIHLFLDGDPLDRFRQIGNHELYQAVLASYASSGFTLIENGDIEDLWMRETQLSGALLDQAFDALGWPLGAALEAEYEDARVRSQAVRIFDNNQDVYQTIRALFHDHGRFVRLAGNHDDYWRSDDYLPALQLVYPGVEVFDYGFIGDYAGSIHSHGGVSPEVLVAHGHQVDAWNNSMCRAAGAAITEAASGIPSLAAGVKERSEWESELYGQGFHNELGEDMTSIDELEFYEEVEDSFSNYPRVPHFVLGHTHAGRKDAQIPGWMYRDERNFAEYTNDGTAGRWEQFIWCATVVNGEVGLHGWITTSSGELRMYTFHGNHADLLIGV